MYVNHGKANDVFVVLQVKATNTSESITKSFFLIANHGYRGQTILPSICFLRART